jgi:transcription antitermination factor NusG
MSRISHRGDVLNGVEPSQGDCSLGAAPATVSTSQHGWAVAIAQPQQEQKAIFNVERAGFQTYCPRIRTKRFYGRKRVASSELLFPRYFFVQMQEQWSAIKRAVGVSGIIMQGERPALLSDATLTGVRSQCDAQGYFIPPSPFQFKFGQRVQIERGPFNGQFGIYKGMRSEERAFVLIQWLGAMRRVDVAEDSLVAA